MLVLLVVTNGAGASSSGRPDGKIAFTARVGGLSWPADLYTVNADGSRLRKLTNNRAEEQSPVWSRDGKTIAYANSGIFTVRANGGKPRVLVSKAALKRYGIAGVSDLSWSRDGRRIAFTAARLGNAVVAWWGVGGKVKLVTQDFGVHPTWSPDGRRVAYAGLNGILVVGATGGNARLISSTVNGDQYPMWSPTGRWIALQHYKYDKREAKEVDALDIVSPSGKVRRRILSGGVIFPAAWSPAGDGILFLRRKGFAPDSPSQLFYVSLRGGEPWPVPGTESAIGSASWHR